MAIERSRLSPPTRRTLLLVGALALLLAPRRARADETAPPGPPSPPAGAYVPSAPPYPAPPIYQPAPAVSGATPPPAGWVPVTGAGPYGPVVVAPLPPGAAPGWGPPPPPPIVPYSVPRRTTGQVLVVLGIIHGLAATAFDMLGGLYAFPITVPLHTGGAFLCSIGAPLWMSGSKLVQNGRPIALGLDVGHGVTMSPRGGGIELSF